MIIELFDSKSFRKWVGQVLLSVDLLKFDIISFYDLSYKVIPAQNILKVLEAINTKNPKSQILKTLKVLEAINTKNPKS